MFDVRWWKAVLLETLWTIELLAGLRAVRREETVARFRTRKAAGLLACLAFRIDQAPPTRDTLIEILWPEDDPKESLRRLAVELNWLRKQLEPPGVPKDAVIRADRYAIALVPAAVSTDVGTFEATLRQANAAASGPERTRLRVQAVRGYGGSLLPQVEGDWIEPERERLAERFLATASAAVDDLLRRDAVYEATEVALIAAQREANHEIPHVLRMRCALAAGDPEEALRRFEELTQLLRESADSAPGADARRLAEEARRRLTTAPSLVASGRAAESPAHRPEHRPDRSHAPASNGRSAEPHAPHLTSSAPPRGIAAILASDIEGREETDPFVQRHHAVLRAEFARTGAYEFLQDGRELRVAFARAQDALDCACACQRAAETEAGSGPGVAALPRFAIDVADLGRAESAPGGPAGRALRDLSRLLAAANGGQIFVSESAHALLYRDLPPGITLRNRGRYRLRSAPDVEAIHEALWSDAGDNDSLAPRAPRARNPVLPPSLTRFFGRSQEMDAIQALFGKNRDDGPHLLTLTGMGGTGKTRIASEAGRLLADRAFAGAVWFVPLAETLNAADVPTAVRSVVASEAPAGKDLWAALSEAFSEEPALLILDNLEQLLEDRSAAEAESVRNFLDSLLTRFPNLRCLATSRRRIGLAAEQELPIPPLPTAPLSTFSDRMRVAPAAVPARTQAEKVLDFPAVALFADRAHRARFDFRVTERNAEAVATLCERLEGIPLALELAAAWARLLTPAEMLAQVDSVLKSRDRGVPDRHRSLDAVVEGSYRLLDEKLQTFFRALSVFRGGWTLDAAGFVVGEPQAALGILSELCDRSLILVDQQEDSTRYRFLESVRTYAAARLAENPEESATVRGCHLNYFSRLALDADKALVGPDQAAWLTRLSSEHQNLTAALERMEPGQRIRAASCLNRYWTIRGLLHEGRRHLADVLAETHDGLSGDEHRRGINEAGVLAIYAGDLDAAEAYFRAYAHRSHVAEDEEGEARAQANLAQILHARGDYAGAHLAYASTVDVWKRLGKMQNLARTLGNLGAVANSMGDKPKSRAYQEESLQVLMQHPVSDDMMVARTYQNLASITSDLEDFSASTYYASQAVRLTVKLNNTPGLPELMIVVAQTKRMLREYPLSARLLGACNALLNESRIKLNAQSNGILQRDMQILVDAMGEDDFAEKSAEGAALSLTEMMALLVRATT